MKVLVTGDTEKSRTKLLIKALAAAGHTIEIFEDPGDNTIRGLSIQEIFEDGELGHPIKVGASHPSDRMRVVTPGKVNNRATRRRNGRTKR